MNTRIRAVDKDEARAAMTAAAFVESDGERIVHCFLGGWCGADWSLDSAIRLIEEESSAISWIDSWISHDLQVITTEGSVYTFGVKRPVGTA